MKALLLEDVRKISIKDHPEPTEKDDHVICKVNAVGICGSDLHYYSEGGIGTTCVGKGFVPGHEFSAILLEAIPEMNLEEEKILNIAKNQKLLDKYLNNKSIKKIIFVKNRLINILVNE